MQVAWLIIRIQFKIKTCKLEHSSVKRAPKMENASSNLFVFAFSILILIKYLITLFYLKLLGQFQSWIQICITSDPNFGSNPNSMWYKYKSKFKHHYYFHIFWFQLFWKRLINFSINHNNNINNEIITKIHSNNDNKTLQNSEIMYVVLFYFIY